jgi:SHAQKYF class myb-like DNA-binding protein
MPVAATTTTTKKVTREEEPEVKSEENRQTPWTNTSSSENNKSKSVKTPPPLLNENSPQEQESKLNANAPQEAEPEPKIARKGQEHLGRWTEPEHDRFLEGLAKHGREWKKVAASVQTRTVMQVRTHAQKYFALLNAGQTMNKFATTTPPTRQEAAIKADQKEKALKTKMGKAKTLDGAAVARSEPAVAVPNLATASQPSVSQPHPNLPGLGNPGLPNVHNLLAIQQQKLMYQHRVMAHQNAMLQQKTIHTIPSRVIGAPVQTAPNTTVAKAPSGPLLQGNDIVIFPDTSVNPASHRPSNQEYEDLLLINCFYWHSLPAGFQWPYVQRLYTLLKLRGLRMVTLWQDGSVHDFVHGPWQIAKEMREETFKQKALAKYGSMHVTGKTVGLCVAYKDNEWNVLDVEKYAKWDSNLVSGGGLVRLPQGVTLAPVHYQTDATSEVTDKSTPQMTPPRKSKTPRQNESLQQVHKEFSKRSSSSASLDTAPVNAKKNTKQKTEKNTSAAKKSAAAKVKVEKESDKSLLKKAKKSRTSVSFPLRSQAKEAKPRKSMSALKKRSESPTATDPPRSARRSKRQRL